MMNPENGLRNSLGKKNIIKKVIIGYSIIAFFML